MTIDLIRAERDDLTARVRFLLTALEEIKVKASTIECEATAKIAETAIEDHRYIRGKRAK